MPIFENKYHSQYEIQNTTIMLFLLYMIHTVSACVYIFRRVISNQRAESTDTSQAVNPLSAENEECVTEREYWEQEEQGDDDEYANADEFDEEEYNDEPLRRNTSRNSPTAMINSMPMTPSHQTGVVRMTARPIVTISIESTQSMIVGRSGYFQLQYPLVPSFPTVSTNRLCGAECMEFTTLRLVALGK